MGVGNWRDAGLIEKRIDKMGNLAEMWPRGKTISVPAWDSCTHSLACGCLI